MPSAIEKLARGRLAGRWAEYLAKAVVLFALFCLIAWLAPMMPPLCLAIVWAALSMASAIGVAYHYVINKARNRTGLEDGGVVARFNAGRTFSLTLAFAISALCVGGLILELPRWQLPEWIMLVAAIPLYVVIFQFVEKKLATQYKPLLRVSRTVAASSAILCAALLVAYLAICLTGPVTHYETMTEAFLGAKQPFADSPSALLADLGYLGALVDGLTAFAMSRVAEGSLAGYVVWRVALCCSTAVGISSLIGACSLTLAQLKLVFQPLSAVDEPEVSPSPMTRYIVIACVLPILLVACTAATDAQVSQMAQTQGYTMVKAALREHVGMAACIIDGKRYDYERVKALLLQAQESSDSLANEREQALTPLINEAFDKRVENVDAYLDWYYSLPADYERLMRFFAGTIESGMQEQLQTKINEGIDETQLDEQLDYYLQRSQELADATQSALQSYELSEDYGLEEIPDWLIKPVEVLDLDLDTQALSSTQRFLDAGERMGLSAGVGVVTGIVATKVTGRIAEKAFFKKIVAGLTEKLAVRGLLAEGGTLVAPGVGTAIGIGVGFAADFLFLKADEALNRETYKQEIINAINECRQDMLAMVSA